MKNYYSVGETAKILSVSTKTIQRWDQSGKLKATRSPAGRRRYSIEQIDEFRSREQPVLRDSITLNRRGDDIIMTLMGANYYAEICINCAMFTMLTKLLS